MDVAAARMAVWSSSGLVLLGLLVVGFGVFKWIGGRQERQPWFWSLMFVALVFSGPLIRWLVLWRTASPTERIVPGLVPTWTPAAVGLGVSLVLWWRLRRAARLSEVVPAT